MTKYIKIFLATISLISIFSVGAVSADASAPLVGDACSGLNSVTAGQGSCGNGSGRDTIKSIAGTVVEILSIIIGIVSVVVLIFAGFRFITAGGDSNTISQARNMIIYAIVGLVIAILAQFIVTHVITTANNINSHSYLNNQSYTHSDA